MNINELQNSLTDIQAKIIRLGAINLAAPEEIASESKRKEELDIQYNDLTTCLHTEQVLADRQPSIQKYNSRQAAHTLAHYSMSTAGAKTIQTYYTVNWSTIALKSAGRGATNSIISSRSGCSTCNSVECNITRGTVTPLSRLGL